MLGGSCIGEISLINETDTEDVYEKRQTALLSAPTTNIDKVAGFLPQIAAPLPSAVDNEDHARTQGRKGFEVLTKI